VRSESLAQSLGQVLSSDRYILYATGSESEFFNFVEQHKQHLDCLVLQDDGSLLSVIKRLYEQGTLLPVVIFPKEQEESHRSVTVHNSLDTSQTTAHSLVAEENPLFHPAEVRVGDTQLAEISGFIDKAIAQFVSLSPASSLPTPAATVDLTTELTTRSFLMQQQRRLSEKLKERLGYLGVYYKRNPQLFLRHLPQNERQKLLENLKSEYRLIVLKYFSHESTLNQQIDNFVDKAFFADISVSKIVEIHMELMEEFSKQLKLEGRSEEVLLDYRLTLIDVIAHLGEMYRRSIPREE
jgi:circadian clock protein KaiA